MIENNKEIMPLFIKRVPRKFRDILEWFDHILTRIFLNELDLVIDKQGDQRVEKVILDALMKLHKISIHFIVEEMADNSFIDKISDALESFVNKFPVPADFALHAINILFYVHLWKLRTLLSKVTS